MEKNTSYPSYIGHGLVAWCIKNVYFYDGYTNVVSYKNENMQLKTMSTVEVINWVLLSSKGNSGHKIFTFFQFSLWPFQKMGLYLKFCVWHFMQTNYCKVQSRIKRQLFSNITSMATLEVYLLWVISTFIYFNLILINSPKNVLTTQTIRRH